MMYIEVLTQIGVKRVDQCYTYHVPIALEDKIKIGIRVKIPFGKMILEGFVMNIISNTTYNKNKIKDILDITDNEPVLNEEMIKLGKYMSDNLFCSLVSAYQVMLPKALKAEINTNIKIKYNKYLRRIKSINEIDEYINNTTIEGLYTLKSIYKLLRRKKVKMPIIDLIYNIIFKNTDPNELTKFLIKKD